ncbi:hypothetical protein CYMTET_33218, partial [Cymbomonas tetramitiformis]
MEDRLVPKALRPINVEEEFGEAAGLQTGETLRITHVQTGFSLHLIVERTKQDFYLLARTDQPYHRLCVSQHSHMLSWKPCMNATALWKIRKAVRGQVFLEGKCGLYLAFSDDGKNLELVPWKGCQSRCGWSNNNAGIDDVESVKLQSLALSTHEDAASFDPANDFLARGFFVLEDLVPAEKVEAALRLLNSSLGSADLAADLETTGIGTEFMDGPGAAVVKLGSGHRCTCSLSQASVLLSLLGPKERSRISSAVFNDRPISGMFGCQVALRFPLSVGEEAANSSIGPFLKRLTWHSDAEKYNEKKKFDFVASLARPLALRRDGSIGAFRQTSPGLLRSVETAAS